MQKTKELSASTIDAYLFDLGGVIVDISPAAAISAFSKLGLSNLEEQITHGHHNGLFKQYELGAVSTQDFIRQIKDLLPHTTTDEQIIDAWNQMLVELPLERLQIIESLKEQVPVYLLSNTNELHRSTFVRMAYGIENIEAYFTKTFYSFEIKHSKPDKGAFEYVIANTGIKPERTLFLDDSQLNLDVADELGFQTVLVSKNDPMTDILGKMST
ncbi:HAD family hydrolase [Carboxylicivirga sp. RSCT41]|uniref:HAD family hydrolase n=1 Tax=Carboxylicivirga agarovorans TaxID=3417570 RepID=UPI003D33617A